MFAIFLLVKPKKIWFNARKRVDMILAGDIGGTNTRLAFFERGQRVGEEKKYPSPKYSGLEIIVQEFLQGKKIERACFGVAGPVRNGKSKVTNLSWNLDAAHISRH
ncbi:MAG: glucokinase, partial [Verrucomicrobia bacterium]|nr:glucokinase [Verrucomicrobiota bacterium]